MVGSNEVQSKNDCLVLFYMMWHKRSVGVFSKACYSLTNLVVFVGGETDERFSRIEHELQKE